MFPLDAESSISIIQLRLQLFSEFTYAIFLLLANHQTGIYSNDPRPVGHRRELGSEFLLRNALYARDCKEQFAVFLTVIWYSF